MGEFDNNFKENDITNKFTVLYSLKQNRKAKRVNYTITGSIQAIMAQQKLAKSLWAKIAKTVIYLQNKSPINQDITTVYKNLKSKKLYLSHLYIIRYSLGIHI